MASKVKYKMDLIKIFDRAYKDRPRQVRDRLRPFISDVSIKRAIAGQAIDLIVHRTRELSIDKNGKSFQPYSESYKKSLAFRIAGKTNKVNLLLSGGMLSSMQASDSRYSITIEFVDQESNDKAHGHIHGTDKLPQRDFFGLPPEEEEKILKKVINSASKDRLLLNLETLISDIRINAQVGRQILTIGGEE